MGDNYFQLVQRISEAAKLGAEEIERRVEAKRAKLSGLVSKEGAAQIVAAELGVNFEQARMKISQLVHGMRRVNVLGKILEIYPVREFNKNGREGKVCNFLLADDSSNTRVVLWDVNHIALIEKGEIKAGENVELLNAGVRNGEIHLGGFSDIKKSKEVIGEIVEKRSYSARELNAVRQGESVNVRAVIVQVFEPRYFEVCPECRKKVTDGKCSGVHGEVKGEKRALLNIVLDDGTETMRCVFFGEQISKLGLKDEEIFDLNVFNAVKKRFLGEEKFFAGKVRSNALYNLDEFIVEEISDVNPQELINEFENKV